MKLYAPVLPAEVAGGHAHGDETRLGEAIDRLLAHSQREREVEEVARFRPELGERNPRLRDGADRGFSVRDRGFERIGPPPPRGKLGLARSRFVAVLAAARAAVPRQDLQAAILEEDLHAAGVVELENERGSLLRL